MTIGERIKQKREELNLSQDELAKKVGYKSRSSIQKIEAARNLPITKVEKMAAALDCTPAFLMGWEEEQDMSSAHKALLEAYVYRERLSMYSQEQITQALNFYDAFSNAAPEIQLAIETLLRGKVDE